MTEHSPTPDEQRVQAALEDLAATANTEPTRPLAADAVASTPSAQGPSRRNATLIAAAFVLLCGAVAVGLLATNDDDPEIGTTPPAGSRTDAPSPAGECNTNNAVELLQSGLPAYDYTAAGSFAAAAANSDLVVIGSLTSASRSGESSDPDASGGTELWFADLLTVPDLNPTTGIDRISYFTYWASGQSPEDPLGEPADMHGISFIAFLYEAPNPAVEMPEVSAEYSVGIEGLYIACDRDAPAEAVIHSAAGPGDPQYPSLNEILDLVGGDEQQESAPLSAAEVAVVDQLRGFASGETAAEDLPLADVVALTMGMDIITEAPATQLRTPDGWTINTEVGFGRVGPFNPLDYLGTERQVTVSTGPHDHCASPPIYPPPGVEGLRQIAIQPAEGSIDSCIDWFAVDVYYDAEANEIHTVTLALWEP